MVAGGEVCVAPAGIGMGEIYASVIPYVLVTLLGLALIVIFPSIALYLPELFFSR